MKNLFTYTILNSAAVCALSVTMSSASAQYGPYPALQQTDTTAVHEDSLVVMVYTTFVIDKKGRVRNAEILQTECDSCKTEVLENCKQEALRVVNDMPRWSTPNRKGNREPKRYNLPVKFVVAKEQAQK